MLQALIVQQSQERGTRYGGMFDGNENLSVKKSSFAQCTNYWIKSRCSDVNFHSWIQSCDRCLGRARNYENTIVSKTSVFASFSIVQPKTKNSKSIRTLRLQYKLN